MKRQVEFLGEPHKMILFQESFGAVQVGAPGQKLDSEVLEFFGLAQGLLESPGVFASEYAILIMGNDAGNWLAQHGHVKRGSECQPHRIDEVVARDAFEPWEKPGRKCKVFLAEEIFPGVIGVAMRNAEVVFEDKSEGSSGSFRYV